MKQIGSKPEITGKKDVNKKKTNSAKAKLLRKQIKKPKVENNFEKLIREKIEFKMKSKQEAKQVKDEFKTKNVANKFKDFRKVKPKEAGGKPFSMLGSLKREKKQIFDLDSDEEPLRLTHQGQNLDEMDDFKEKLNESSDEGEMDKEIVSKLHFGGFDEGTAKHFKGKIPIEKEKKSKKEVYEEIIKKSKLMKFEKQKLKEENQMKLEELDNDFSQIAGLLRLNKNQKDENGKRRRAKADEEDKDGDDYFVLAKQLANDKKAYASENLAEKVTKTKKEREKRKKQTLQNLEDVWSSEGEQAVNDDELEEKFSSKRQGLGYSHDKELKKVQKLDSLVGKLKAISSKKKAESDDEFKSSGEEVDDLDDISDDDEDDDEENDDDLGDLLDDDSLIDDV